MSMSGAKADDFLTISPRIRVMPMIHGSGDFAIQVREELLSRPYDCVAVPLPPSFQEDVEAAIEELPQISIVVQVDAETGQPTAIRKGRPGGFSYVPIDPCQGVIAALRTARGERIAREFIDLETPRFVAVTGTFPDPYALKRVSPRLFSAALLYAMPRPLPGQSTRSNPLDGRRGCRSSNRGTNRSSWSARSSTGPGSAKPIRSARRRRSKRRFSRRSCHSQSTPRT